MAKNDVLKTNFKGFMTDSAASLNKLTQIYIKSSLQFQYKQICKDYKDVVIMGDVKTKYHVIHFWWLSSGAATEEGILGLSEWLGF